MELSHCSLAGWGDLWSSEREHLSDEDQGCTSYYDTQGANPRVGGEVEDGFTKLAKYSGGNSEEYRPLLMGKTDFQASP